MLPVHLIADLFIAPIMFSSTQGAPAAPEAYAAAATSCRSYTTAKGASATIYTKCDDGKLLTPRTSCRTYKVGSTVRTKCK
jgi:hypothetical protein